LLSITVNTLADENNGVGVGGISLREAIAAAAPGETIDFSVTGTINMVLGTMTIDKSLTINGPGASLLTLDASGNDPTPTTNNGDGSRVFSVQDGNSANVLNVQIAGLTLTGGDVTGLGGAIFNLEKLAIVDSVLVNNFATDDGGGIWSSGALTVSGSTLRFNSGNTGGGIFSREGELIVEQSVLEENSARAVGAGIRYAQGTAQINQSVIRENSASGSGGGIHNTFATLQVRASTISGNTGKDAGGIYTADGNTSIIDSTISGNQATAGGGGGIWNLSGGLTLSNSTLSGNAATGDGGGLHVRTYAGQTARIVHSTIASNQANSDFNGSGQGGGIFVHPASGAIALDHTIIGNNDLGDVAGSVAARFSLVTNNSGAAIIDNGGNLIGTAGAPIDPVLGPLEDHGGVTSTRALLTGSPAIDRGDPLAVAGSGNVPLHDQRGNPLMRVFGGRIDIGAYERQSSAGARNFVVDQLKDERDGNYGVGDLSLREAIGLANGNLGFRDTIEFASSLTSGGPARILLTLGELGISSDITLNGPGADKLTIDALGESRILFISDPSSPLTLIDVEVTGLRLIGGDASFDGGAILSEENLTLERVTIAGNHAGRNGGGIAHSFGRLSVIASAIHDNTAGEEGGGLWSATSFAAPSIANISNSTISGNFAFSHGGGVRNFDGQMVVRFSTITNNQSLTNNGSGIASWGDSRTLTEIHSSIIAENQGSDIDTAPSTTNSNSFQSNGYNLIGTGNAVMRFNQPGDRTDVANAMLGPLANYGGPTLSHALLVASPAINGGNPASIAGMSGVPTFDQRGSGFPRIEGGRIDIGAYEASFNVGTSLTVDTLADELDGDHGPRDLSLREALALANLDQDIQTIEFATALTSGGPAHITLTMGELAITKSVTINGPGANLLRLDASGNNPTPNMNNGDGSRVLNITDGNASNVLNVHISGMTFVGGDVRGMGGAIFNLENLIVIDSVVSNNAATDDGGGIWNSGALTVRGSTIGANSGNTGGGIFSREGALTIEESTVEANSANAGGGIRYALGIAQIARSTIRDNVASGAGGGIHNTFATLEIRASTVSGNVGKDAGGVYSAEGNTAIIDSTISGNSTTAGSGGGIWSLSGGLSILNSTISGNAATSDGGGVHVRAYAGQTARIAHSTIGFNRANSDNDGSGQGGGVFIHPTSVGPVALDHTIVSDNNRGDVTGPANVRYSLIENSTGAAISDNGGNLIGVKAHLLPLADNGGLTATHALAVGSPAVDAGDSTAVAAMGGVPQFDQRGEPSTRVLDGDTVGGIRIDIGALESTISSVPKTTGPGHRLYYGDYDNNGAVDAADYVIWRKGGTLPNDFTSGSVTAGDYVVWRANFGRAGGTGSALTNSAEEAGVTSAVSEEVVFAPHVVTMHQSIAEPTLFSIVSYTRPAADDELVGDSRMEQALSSQRFRMLVDRLIDARLGTGANANLMSDAAERDVIIGQEVAEEFTDDFRRDVLDQCVSGQSRDGRFKQAIANERAVDSLFDSLGDDWVGVDVGDFNRDFNPVDQDVVTVL
jgi:CSLREA domain-containing protein